MAAIITLSYKKYCHFSNILLLLFFLKNIEFIKSETTTCPKNTPILISGVCKLEYCSKEKFNLGQCIIANSNIKTQWINNIIKIGNSTFIYVNFAKFSNGDLIVETSSYPKSQKRMFFGLRNNGRPFYKKNSGEDTSYYSINSGGTEGLFESEASTIKITSNNANENGKEYFIVMGKYENYAEIFDFSQNKVYYKNVASFTSISSVKTLRHAILPLPSTSQFYYLFGFMGGNTDSKVYFQKHIFNSLNNFANTNTYDQPKSKDKAYGRQVSCFVTKAELIICFYLTKDINKVYFNFHKYDKNLSKEKISTYASIIDDQNLFCKCIHLKEEIGIFASYYTISSNTYPFLFIREFKNNDFQSYLTGANNYYSAIVLQKPKLLTNVLLNDIVKMNDNKIAFSSTLESKETFYIILVNFFGEKKYKIRYYDIPIFPLYNYKIFSELRINNYNNFVAFASSFCRNQICNKDSENFTALMIFSYPNSSDITFSLDEYLFNNNISIESIEIIINLKNQLVLENNIFGYILSCIIISESGEGSDFKLYSSKNKSNEIKKNYTLENDENIILKYIGDLNYIKKLDKKIEYYFIAIEPEYNIYENFPEQVGGDNDETFFTKEEYIGRLTYYKIKLENELSNDCIDINCELCLKENKESCIICKYNFTIIDGIKTCYNPKVIESTIEQIETFTTNPETFKITDILTDPKIDSSIITDYITEGKIESTMVKITEPLTEVKIESTIIKITNALTEGKIESTLVKSVDVPTSQITEKVEEKEYKEITEKLKIKTDIITEKIKDEENSCSEKDIIKNKCTEGLMNEEQIEHLFKDLKENYLTTDYNGENTIIQTENVIFQISSLKDQKNDDNPNVSSIDLGECEQELINHYKIPKNMSLIMFKTDIKTKDLTQTYVQYEIYDPRNMTIHLDLSICKDMKIIVNSPIKLDISTSHLYDNLKESGYDLFNESDSFYTDICSIYTSKKGTDMTLTDRKQEIYSSFGNKSLCQSGCELEYYNSTNKKAKCDCSPQTNEIEPVLSSSNKKFNAKKIADSFFSTLKNSNFFVLKCYKLAIDLKSIFSNIGRIFMTIILMTSLIFLILFLFYDYKKIENYIKSIINNKLKFNKKKENFKKIEIKKNFKKNDKTNKSKVNEKNKKKIKTNQNNQNKNSSKNKKSLQNKDKVNQKKSKKCKKIDVPPKKMRNSLNKNINSKVSKFKEDIIISKNNLLKRSTNSTSNINIVKIKNCNIKNVIEGKKQKKNSNKSKKNSILDIQINSNIQNYYQSSNDEINLKENLNDTVCKNDKNIKNDYNYKNLNDHELNTLEYEIAIIIDKRNYFQYYWSLLKKKHLLFFTFYPTSDYNLFSIKICLLLLSFSLYFSINGFFFSDETMHKIHEDNGAFNIVYQIPQILYSSVISALINIILKQLSLSEKNILSLKQEKDIKKMGSYAKNIKKCLKIKFIIFFILNHLFLLFFWYFISCFCAVYKNTQIILIEDTLISFGLSMLYPFGLNLLPGIFRIPSLRAQNKNKKILYKISELLALI